MADELEPMKKSIVNVADEFRKSIDFYMHQTKYRMDETDIISDIDLCIFNLISAMNAEKKILLCRIRKRSVK